MSSIYEDESEPEGDSKPRFSWWQLLFDIAFVTGKYTFKPIELIEEPTKRQPSMEDYLLGKDEPDLLI